MTSEALQRAAVEGKHIAPEGYAWRCVHCGRWALDRLNGHPDQPGWDVSCFLNAQLITQAELWEAGEK